MTGPDPDDDLADRVSALEQQQRADRRALGSLDADLSDVQAQRRQDVRLMQTLRDTQLEHGERLERLETLVVGLDSRVTGLESQLVGIESRVVALGSRLVGIESRVVGLGSRLVGFESATATAFAAVDSRLDVIVELLRRDSP